jgi:hypothetical protein
MFLFNPNQYGVSLFWLPLLWTWILQKNLKWKDLKKFKFHKNILWSVLLLTFFKKSWFWVLNSWIREPNSKQDSNMPPHTYGAPRILVDLNMSSVWCKSSWTPSQMSPECKFCKAQLGHTCNYIFCNVISKNIESAYNNRIKYIVLFISVFIQQTKCAFEIKNGLTFIWPL